MQQNNSGANSAGTQRPVDRGSRVIRLKTLGVRHSAMFWTYIPLAALLLCVDAKLHFPLLREHIARTVRVCISMILRVVHMTRPAGHDGHGSFTRLICVDGTHTFDVFSTLAMLPLTTVYGCTVAVDPNRTRWSVLECTCHFTTAGRIKYGGAETQVMTRACLQTVWDQFPPEYATTLVSKPTHDVHVSHCTITDLFGAQLSASVD